MSDAGFIAVSAPDLSELEIEYVSDAIRSTWVSSAGPWLNRFETQFAQLCGTQQALSVCNGTAALHLALLGLGIGPGDEVIVPSLTYVASTNAVHYCGATPVFVDVDPVTWCMDPARVAEAITPRTRAIMPVHLYGHPCDMDAINTIAKQASAWVLEDAAEAHFATYKGRTVGSLGDIASFSFYGNKIVTSGEGGALTFSNAELGERLKMLRGQGMDPNRRYYFPIVGYNYRLTNVACAMLCAQLDRRQDILRRRADLYALYNERLAEQPGIRLQTAAPYATVAPWIYCVVLDGSNRDNHRDTVADRLRAAGIETRPFFFPNHRLPSYCHLPSSDDMRLVNTIRLGACGLNLPTHSGMTVSDVDRACEELVRAVRAST